MCEILGRREFTGYETRLGEQGTFVGHLTRSTNDEAFDQNSRRKPWPILSRQATDHKGSWIRGLMRKYSVHPLLLTYFVSRNIKRFSTASTRRKTKNRSNSYYLGLSPYGCLLTYSVHHNAVRVTPFALYRESGISTGELSRPSNFMQLETMSSSRAPVCRLSRETSRD